jgi:CBS domain-containing protein
MLVGEVLRAKGHDKARTIGPDVTIGAFVETLMDQHIGAVAVCDAGGGIIGMISERDIVRGISEIGAGVADVHVRDLMTADVVVCNSGDSMEGIREMMIEGRFRHMPVVEEGELIGMVSMRDVVIHLKP